MEPTARLRHPSGPLALGADGLVPASAAREGDGCCPDALCIDPCAIACSFVDLLPSGPMWDRQKEEAKLADPDCGEGFVTCPSMAMFAVYAAKTLHDAVSNIIWPSIREANPATAVTTLDDWLERYRWQDCYRTFCRDGYIALFSPYEGMGECGMEYFPTDFSDQFECALKHGILQSLVRASRGVIKNIDGINWVIEPLGAALAPRRPWPDDVRDFLTGACDDDGEPPCFCDVVELELCHVVEELPGCPAGPCDDVPEPVAARQAYTKADGSVVQLYPGVIAAECIVRSLLTRKCPNIIFRCEE